MRYSEFNIEQKRWEHRRISLPRNPCFDREGVILVPKDFLCVLPTINKDGFSEFISGFKSEQLRAELNYEIEGYLDADTIVEIAEKYPEWVEDYIEYKEKDETVAPYDLSTDDKNLYRPQKEAYNFVGNNSIHFQKEISTENDFKEFLDLIINQFKHYVEEQGGYRLLWNDPTGKEYEPLPRQEDSVQYLFLGIISSYCKIYNVDPSREPETGRGPVDFKLSSGYNLRALIEIKLAKNSKLKQGFERQLPTYLKAQQIKLGFYVIISYEKEDSSRVNKTLEKVKSSQGNFEGNIILIDASREKKSASKL